MVGSLRPEEYRFGCFSTVDRTILCMGQCAGRKSMNRTWRRCNNLGATSCTRTHFGDQKHLYHFRRALQHSRHPSLEEAHQNAIATTQKPPPTTKQPASLLLAAHRRRLPSLRTPRLIHTLALLLLLLAVLHSTGARNSLSAQVRTVALLGRGADDGLVDLARRGVGGE